MAYSDFDKLKSFFLALNKSNFHPERMDPKIITPQDKVYCFNLLREKIPDLKGKDDNYLIEFLRDPQKVKSRILGEFVTEERVELEKSLEEKPVTEEAVGGEVSGQGAPEQQEVQIGTETGTSAGGMPGMPSFPSISPAQRRIYRVSRQEPPKPEIHVANASGYVTEAGDASKLVRTTSTGVVKEAGEPSKLVAATESGAVKETPPSKIFIADRTGAITGEHPIMPASAPKLPSRKKEKKRWFGRLRPSASSNLLDFLPIRQIANWFYRNAIKPLAQWLGRNVLQPLARWAAQTAGRVLLPFAQRLALSALQGLLSMLGGLSGIGGLAGLTFAAGSALLWGIVAVVSFVAVTVLATFLSLFITPIKEPIQVNYTLPLREPKVVPPILHDIKTLIQESLPGAQVNNWQTIIDAAVANNWNPALILTLWIEASGAQEKVDRFLVCDPDPAHPESNLDLNLRCFFTKFSTGFDDSPDKRFPEFIKAYAESNTPRGENYESYYNEDFLQRIKYWYTQMVPDGEWAIKEITPGETTGISGCPVTGIITNPYGYNLPDYPYKNTGCLGIKTTYTNCHNGIDIDAEIGTDIKSPMKGSTIRGEDNIKGKYIEIHETTQVESEIFVTFDHLSEYAAKFYLPGESNIVVKGEVIGKTGDSGESTGPHLHYKINKRSNDGDSVQNPFIYLKGSATLDSDVLTKEATILKNNYAEIRHEPGSITNNWGTCDTLPSP